VTFTPTIITTATTYNLIRTKRDARTYQEVMMTLLGANSRQAQWRMTGRWTDVPSAHERDDGQIVMRPTFTCATPHTQTTTPHFFGWVVATRWNH
jgi:hypothetical protein